MQTCAGTISSAAKDEYGNCIRMRKCRKYITGRYLRNFPRNIWREKEELRSAALRSYTRYISDENFCFIRNHVERIPETDALRGILDALLARADVLKDAVLSGDYVAMRRYADAGSLLASLKSGAERLREWEPPEQEQLDLFTDYSLDGIQDEESMSMSM